MSANVTTREDPKTTIPAPAPAAHHKPQAVDDHDLPKDLKRAHPALIIGMVVLFAGLLAAMFIIGWIPHERQETQAGNDAMQESSGIPIVTVTTPRVAQSSQDINVPCDLRANAETAIYARTSGYLKSFTHDIGATVKEGEVLARIDSPEVDAQLLQSRAALQQAQASREKANADLAYAKRTIDRYHTIQAEGGVVAPQEMDDKQSALDQAQASLDQAEANINAANADIHRLTALQSFEVITAPFTGVITARNDDVGALISPGNSMGSIALFQVAQVDVLRAFVNVPQVYASQVFDGQPATLAVRNFPGMKFNGKVARNTHAINTATRTILFEVDFTNTDSAHPLYPGMYGTATIHISKEQPTLVIDSSALIFNAQGAQVAVVKDGVVHFQPITVDRDLGSQLEITGLTPQDTFVINPGQRLAEGVKVQAHPLEPKSEISADAH